MNPKVAPNLLCRKKNPENVAINARNISTWTNIFVPIYFYEEISFQLFEDRETDVIAIKA